MAQTVIRGSVNDIKTNQELSFVNIGVKGKSLGSVSREDGSFSIKITPHLKNDTLTFSYVGYEPQSWPINKLIRKESIQILLSPKSLELEELVISGGKGKQHRLGRKSQVPFIWGWAESDSSAFDVLEVAKPFRLKNRSMHIESVNIFLKEVSTTHATFRVKFYKYSENKPDRLLFEKNIIKSTAIENGWLSIDLTDYDIYLSEDFVVSIEFFPSDIDNKHISFWYGGQFGGRAFKRIHSLDNWKVTKGLTYALYIDGVSYKNN
ncbi:MAG: carboxypeptidase-like regulatory domain-containing protein [Bacteroidota bacterium]